MILNMTQHRNMKFSVKDFFSECDQICCFLQICSHLLKKSLMENFIFLWSVNDISQERLNKGILNISNFKHLLKTL